MISESSISQFTHVTRRPFRFERFYKNGKKMWQAACQFDVSIDLDSSLDGISCSMIEYRQYIRGGVWIRRGNNPWTADNDPNGNAHFPIPPYGGCSGVTGIPAAAVSGTGLSLKWKEDGQIESGNIERYGYRATATVNAANEIDRWSNPGPLDGRSYRLRDTPSIAGEWGSGLSVEVWIELYFKGFVVEVNTAPDGSTKPVRVLKQKDWSYFWPEKKLNLWMDAVEVS